jgi:hypothetical protein
MRKVLKRFWSLDTTFSERLQKALLPADEKGGLQCCDRYATVCKNLVVRLGGTAAGG